ncbi:MAG: Peptidase M14 carboxypeptidase A [Parcubacteria group bacterium GW2011_GWC1_42_11]|uniref:Peptidase M14 carboxypeptidase A n=1 Tax=Candidatus Nomurabacteria bacterium GW2011_GWC2_42_20 TaxID=1618756 RepID=A0A0G1BMX6_9BACT|nr:MAG: Peptidase M14 carboxypeptidase A [Parcubacteria group bacterium GW2011_GWC1_42_11]KKS47596.1 MAG: Peptidase M14 carboxypeptidase A [Candidatus Nomurabacteria bacterium GW2011_GWC2_42_20]KKT09539.1 MAG: Peptidase M14 carboxypeptidase A [Candidatus Nomurabacteria bacterium GW2011_GWB1_43_20]TAN35932.1 MAG: hypothetical protein EPN27_02765 [Patescibacteria group bacterium]HBH71493.1 hypothetical protein [Candidatus Yonathbacteria bacterium]
MKNRRVKNTVAILGVIMVLVAIGILILTSQSEKITPEPQREPAVSYPVHKVIGKSVEGRNIDAYMYGAGPTHLMFVGGIHGGYEWNSVVLLYQFMDYLKENLDVIPKNITVAVIPSANPDGVYRVIKKEGRFAIGDVPTLEQVNGTGRFNAHEVDINRNFDCKWKPESTWKSKVVSAGVSAFSEPEAVAIRDFVSTYAPAGAIFWHSKANAVYASECEDGILPKTLDIMNVYSQASGYKAIKTFDAYEVSGDVEGWLASINIPAITVELKTHETVEWERNLAGIKAILKHYEQGINY